MIGGFSGDTEQLYLVDIWNGIECKGVRTPAPLSLDLVFFTRYSTSSRPHLSLLTI